MWISSVIFAGMCSLKTALFLKVYDSKKKKTCRSQNNEIYVVDGSTASTTQPKLIRT